MVRSCKHKSCRGKKRCCIKSRKMRGGSPSLRSHVAAHASGSTSPFSNQLQGAPYGGRGRRTRARRSSRRRSSRRRSSRRH